jgi:antirestriction protein ArdC
MQRDLYREVTDRIIASLEAGVAPWIRPWTGEADSLPVNAASHRAYRGINVVLLTLTGTARGYALNRWLTFRQAVELGGRVRRGEHGTQVVFYKLHELPGSDEPEPKVVPLLRTFTVFNVCQIDGLPRSLSQPPEDATDWNPCGAAEAMLDRSGAAIQHGGNRAFYHPGTDTVQLPPRTAFPDPAGYYCTALHELIHATAHPSRCARDLSGRFGDAAYAAEELVAEMGSAFLCAHCRLEGRLQHASYIASWLNVLRNDKRAIFTAAAKAQAAADYVLSD